MASVCFYFQVHQPFLLRHEHMGIDERKGMGPKGHLSVFNQNYSSKVAL